MAYNFILDVATPVVIENNSVAVDFSFLRKLLIVIKSDTDTNSIITLNEPSIDPLLANVNAGFDAGLNSIDYIYKDNLDLSALELKGNYYTIVAIGFDDTELSTKDLGIYDGVFGYNILSGVKGNVLNEFWTLDPIGYTTIYTIALVLAQPEWKTIQYKSSNKNLYFVENAGEVKAVYNAGGVVWAKDAQVGLRLMSQFINNQSVIKPYVYKEISLVLQQAEFNGLASGLNYTKGDSSYVQTKGSNLITERYLDTGKINSFDLSIALSNTSGREFIATLEIEVPESIWIINNIIIGR